MDTFPRIAEYAQAKDAPWAVRTVLRSKFCDHVAVKSKVEYAEVSAGYVPAGSMARWDDACISIRWTDRTGAFQGRKFKMTDQDLANAYWLRLFPEDV